MALDFGNIEVDVEALVRVTGAIKPVPVFKTQARPAELKLRISGVQRTPSGDRVYRMTTRDGQYVGRTNPTKVRALKGDNLRIQASHFATDDWGNVQWQNPNVVGRHGDRAHSWKELEALAGGPLEKDGAAGAAGDMPAAGDEGATAAPPAGPTRASIHIPAPLPNISVAYAGRNLKGKEFKVLKAAHKQLVYGVVLEPNTMDSQDDFMLPDQVEKAAHRYMKKALRGKSSVTKLQHKTKAFFKNKPSVVPVESFVAPVDFTYDGKEYVKAGSWVMVMHVEDPGLWQDFLDGKYTGFSIGGDGIRQSYHQPSGVPRGFITSEANTWIPEVNDLLRSG